MDAAEDAKTLDRVVQSIARTTRYPVDLLTPSADLENDLGIDSVKRLEIVVGLSDEFGLSLESEERDSSIRTIQNVSDWVASFLAPKVQVARVDAPPTHVVPPPRSRGTADATESTVPIHAKMNMLRGSSAANESPAINHTDRLPIRDHNTDQASYWPSHRPLDGRVALVTGSGRGVGRVVARLLASKGATVIVNSFHSRADGEQTAADINDLGGSAVHLWGSVANPKHVDQIFQQIEGQFGRLDILICNASDGRIGSFMELNEDDWDRAFRTNVTGHHRCAVRATPLMQSVGGGSIVTMSAVGANGYIEGLGSQGVVKAAVESMTRYLACELGQFGIRVNCVAGGPVYGELLSKFENAQATQNHWESITADGELCSPMDLANAISFLVSEEARGINGSVWMVDHGFSAIADGRPRRFAGQRPIASKVGTAQPSNAGS